MIIESTALFGGIGVFAGLGFLVVGIFGIIGTIGKAIFGGKNSTKTSSSASYDRQIEAQAASQRQFQQQMLMLQQQQAQQKGGGISPMLIFGGIALVGAMVVLPKVMGR